MSDSTYKKFDLEYDKLCATLREQGQGDEIKKIKNVRYTAEWWNGRELDLEKATFIVHDIAPDGFLGFPDLRFRAANDPENKTGWVDDWRAYKDKHDVNAVDSSARLLKKNGRDRVLGSSLNLHLNGILNGRRGLAQRHGVDATYHSFSIPRHCDMAVWILGVGFEMPRMIDSADLRKAVARLVVEINNEEAMKEIAIAAYALDNQPISIPQQGRDELRNVHAEASSPEALPLADRAASAAKRAGIENSHSADFRSVKWNGNSYTLSATRAKVIAMLWESMEKGVPEISWAKLQADCEFEAKRPRDLFKPWKEYNHLLTAGSTKGTVKLK
ncbi:MAG: hypothetical protein HS116_19200 [Planctomycetes bacterium]|nr:hypothetical protein [Planctomycetota bacterium]